ncbi:unnamed protein product [Arctia plantaginis]|uniref:Uncharacterized protein n=1 Tax=Arctia plantaginis TaxID=874455 RepID=A0A8S0ZRB9_ARCPL|nr:unnamed protein product [Arctia plantaginis]
MIPRRDLIESRTAAHASRLLLAAGPRLRAHIQRPEPLPLLTKPLARQAATRQPYGDMFFFVSNLIVTLSANELICA